MIKYLQNHKSKLVIVLMLIVIMLLLLNLSNLAAFAEEVNPNIQFEKLDLEEELKSISTFDFVAHPPISLPTKITPSIYKVIEYCYSYYANYNTNYGIYVYIYNPSQLDLIENGKNKITLATKHKIVDNAQIATDYEKFDLKFISKTDGAYKNLFYKFKIVDKQVEGKSMYERVNKLCRQYDISEIELQEKNSLSANYLVTGGRFKFEGYAAGYGYDEEETSTLVCTQEGLETLELELKHTWFRTETSSYGKGYQNQLDAVYFTVPNDIFEEYGELKQIKAQWYEYKTSPIVVLSDINYYNNLKGNEGIKSDRLWAIGTDYTLNSTTQTGICDWGFNVPTGVKANKFKSDFLAYIQYCEKNSIKDWVYKSEELRNYIYSYNKSYHTGKIDVYSSVTGTNISNDLFMNYVDLGHTRGFNQKIFDADQVNQKFNLLDYSSNHSGWQKFKDYFFSYPQDQSYTNISPILKIDKGDIALSDEEFSTKYLIDIKQVSDFKDYVEKSSGVVIKFNFGFSQYESNVISEDVSAPLGGNTYSERGVMAQETVYLDFDVIWLKFKKGLDETIIPVAALPIDAIADITAPPWLPDNPLAKFWEAFVQALMWIAIFIIGIIIIRILWVPFKLLFSTIFAKKPKTKVNITFDTKDIKNQQGNYHYNKNEVKLAKDRFKRKKE